MITVGISTLKLTVGELRASLVDSEVVRAGTLEAGTATIDSVLDVSGAEVRGFMPVIGSYANPALDTTVTLTTGGSPAGRVSWGDFQARAALGVNIEDPSGTIDEGADIRHSIIQDPSDPTKRMFEFTWVNDPGSDVDLNVSVGKFI